VPSRRPDAELRVALLNPCYWPEVRRGSERFARELADGLLARGDRPSLITSHPGRPRRSVEDGLRVIRLPRPPQRWLVRRGYESYLTHVPLSYLALRSARYDVAHALYPTDALAAARWRRRTGRPAVLSYMGIPTARWLAAGKARRGVLVRAAEGCDAVVVLSDYAARAYRQSLGREVRVIHPGVDLGRFVPAEARAERPTIVCPAAVEEPRKNVALLLEAFALVRERVPEARLVLSRPGDRAAAARAGVDAEAPGVQWRDLDDQRSLARAYGEAWVAVLPAVDEAFGLVLVEALACGTPVVGFAGGGIPEIVDREGIGRLFDRLEPEALAGAIIETLETACDPGTAERCRAHAGRFSIDLCTERYLSLYRELARAR
jgi:glycosyltransferase involved in cell wall biosynthesis